MLEYINNFFPDPLENLRIVLAIIYTIWFYSWVKKHVGSAKFSIVISVIIVYLGFFTNDLLIWLPIVLWLFAFFGTGLFEKIPEGKRKPDYLRD